MILAAAARDAHAAVAWVVVIANGLAGLWALGAHAREALRRRELWWFTTGAQVLIFVQAGLGVWLQTSEDLEPPDFHLLYGFTMLIAVAIIYSYRFQMPDHRHLLYSGGGLFLMGMGIRAMII